MSKHQQQQNEEDYNSSTSSSSFSTGSSNNLKVPIGQDQPCHHHHPHGVPHTTDVTTQSEKLSTFPLSTHPHTAPVGKTSSLIATATSTKSFGQSSSRLSSVFSVLWSGKRKKKPTTSNVKQALEKLDKLTAKTIKQEANMIETLREWGLGLPDSASRDLVANISNIIKGKFFFFSVKEKV